MHSASIHRTAWTLAERKKTAGTLTLDFDARHRRRIRLTADQGGGCPSRPAKSRRNVGWRWLATGRRKVAGGPRSHGAHRRSPTQKSPCVHAACLASGKPAFADGNSGRRSLHSPRPCDRGYAPRFRSGSREGTRSPSSPKAVHTAATATITITLTADIIMR